MIFRFLSGGLRFLIILEFWILIILMDTVKLDTYYFDGYGAQYDAGRIIHDPKGGYWLHPKCYAYLPDMKQVSKINPEYILHRWNWEKNRQNQSDIQTDIQDEAFRGQLESKNYVKKI